MADLNFYARFTADGDSSVDNLSGSGLGFYGGGFGLSVAVGSYQDTTFVTSSDGTTQGIQADNTKWSHPNSGILNSASSGIPLTALPNDYATMNVRFTHTDNVRVQNAKARVFDRVNIDNAASGVTTKLYEVRHPVRTQSVPGVAGQSSAWTSFTFADGGSELSLTASPGGSGTNATGAGNGALTTEGSSHQSTRHDWYLAISASPDSIGSKTQYGLYVSLEYL